MSKYYNLQPLYEKCTHLHPKPFKKTLKIKTGDSNVCSIFLHFEADKFAKFIS